MSTQLLDKLKQHANTQPNKKVWSFLTDTCDINDSYTYIELLNASKSLSIYLLEQCNIKRGDRVLLVFFPGLSFMASLLACFHAGIVAVPVFPPDPRKLQKDLHHFISIQQSSGSTVVLTHSIYDFAKKVSGLKSFFSTSNNASGKAWPDMKWINVDDALKHGKSSKSPVSKNNDINTLLSILPSDNDLAFLQYTSGSTSEPKGVMITHGTLAHNLTIIIKELNADKDTVCVSWLPQYHDMGLIGSYLGTLYCGGSGYYLSPISFLKDPVQWMYALSKFKGTHTQAPNFAFALVCRKFKEYMKSNKNSSGSDIMKLDLSSIQHMINAAEPVDSVAIDLFYKTFEQYLLPRNVVYPTYGLAEHCVFVCSGGDHVLTVKKSLLETKRQIEVISSEMLNRMSNSTISVNRIEAVDHDVQAIVGCGYPGRADGVQLIIVNEETRVAVGSDTVGEVWVTSPSKAKGYYGKPDQSIEDFHATLVTTAATAIAATAADTDGYLRTGDLGFVHNNELFICGRLKDLIIVRGSNHYPQDIERTAEYSQQPILRAGCSAAFSIKHEGTSTETVIYVAEVKDDTITSAQLLAAIEVIKSTITSEHGLGLSSVCLLRPRTVPKTTSGKIARAWCRKAFLDNTLSILQRWDGTPDNVPTAPTATTVTATATINSKGSSGHSSEDLSMDKKAIEDQQPEPLLLETIRSLPIPELVKQLSKTLVRVASQSASPLSEPINTTASMISMGMDSLTIIQFKAVIERNYHCNGLPDEFFFTQLCTIDELAQAVHTGELTPKQKHAMDAGMIDNGDGQSTNIEVHSEPLCPWFTCCM